MKITKTTYLHGFALITMVLALVRCAFGIAGDGGTVANGSGEPADSIDSVSCAVPATSAGILPAVPCRMSSADSVVPVRPVITGDKARHKIMSVPSYREAFPDSNSVQLVSAQRWGVQPVRNRIDAEKRKSEVVFVGCNPYFHVNPLTESIPYLVPRASILLQDIGRAFYDSLYVKGLPLHQIIVTSVLRSEEDIRNLHRYNQNASENSCHRFGTTFDLAYNKYYTVQTAACPRREVRNDTLKWVLAEVLRDMRESGRCYIKYEVKQPCFHITVR